MTSGITQSSELQVLTNKAPVVVGIHQPNYLPWFGYFLKMAASDIFVFHDDAGLNSKGLTRRVRISHQEPHRQPRWLSVPLQRHAANTRICNLHGTGTIWLCSQIRMYMRLIFPKSCPWWRRCFKPFRKLSCCRTRICT